MSKSTPSSSRRPYNAEGRRAQARATRDRILDVARDLFIANGFAGTSIAGIAEVAGVSVPTVFARFGSKAALLKEAVESAIVGDTDPIPFADRPEMRHVRAGRSARQVMVRLADLIASAGPRVVPIAMVMYAAADADPEIRALAREQDELRLAGAELLAATALDRLGSHDRAHLEELRDLIWTMNAPQTYDLLVNRRGWSTERYATWVARTLSAAIKPLP